MSRRKKKVALEEQANTLNEQIAETVAGLVYMSESDAPIIAFAGQQADSVTSETVLLQIGKSNDLKIEVNGFDDFFAPLIKMQKWFGEDERKMTEKFVQLKELLKTNLIQKKVLRIGKKEIDIFVVGLDSENILRGIQTKATET
ncbi:MAG: nuclease A inhibitor family protein [Pyrinomonadaceae bacterium]|nr:nuclease A inhibitor family protein [Pyrinomonadaceae bacterium]